MSGSDPINDLIQILIREKVQGTTAVVLSAENLAFLASGSATAAVRPQAPAASAPPPAATPVSYKTPVVPEASDAMEIKDETVPDLNVSLDALQDVVSSCKRCVLCKTRKQTVFGVGNPDADLMFIGEGPGADEDRQGIPFVGRAGQLLTRMIQAMGLEREDVYIANIVKCRPPGNRNPEEDEAAECMPYLKRQIELVAPRVIVLLGAVPLKYMLDKTGITRLRGIFVTHDGIQYMPTFHPSYLLRMQSAKADVWKDLQTVMETLGMEPK